MHPQSSKEQGQREQSKEMNRDSPWIQVTQLQEVAQPPHPSCPISGWRSVTEDTYRSIAPSIPPVTSGMLHAGLQHSFIAMKSDSIYYTLEKTVTLLSLLRLKSNLNWIGWNFKSNLSFNFHL